MRLNRLGVKLIALFGVVGLVMIAAAWLMITEASLGVLGGVIFGFMGLCYVGASLVAIGVALNARRKIRHNRWLARNGIRGRATIVDAVSELSVNEQPLFKLVVDLDIPGQEPRRVERSIIVGSFAARRMKPGLVMPAYAHPRDPDDLLLMW